MSKPTTLLALAAPLLLAGCLGSNVPYRPGHEPRPAQVTEEDEEARALRLAVPMEIERHDWYLRQGRERVGEILGDIHRNPFNAYEQDLAALGPEEGDPYARDHETRLLRAYGSGHTRAYLRARNRPSSDAPAPREGDEDEPDGGGDDGGGWGDGGGDDDGGWGGGDDGGWGDDGDDDGGWGGGGGGGW